MELTSNSTIGANFTMQWLNASNPELLYITNHNWLRFPPPSCYHHYAVGVINVILMITGTPMNLIVILTILISQLPKRKYMMNLCLAASDFLTNMEIPFIIGNSFSCGPVNFTPGQCQAYGFIGGFSGTASIACITAMAYQRYARISRPFRTRQVASTGRTVVLIFICCIHGIAFAIVPLISPTITYKPEGYLTSCSFDYFDKTPANVTYILLFGLFAYIVPLILISFFYYRIVVIFKASTKEVIALQIKNQEEDMRRNLQILEEEVRRNSIHLGAEKSDDRESGSNRPASAVSVTLSSTSSQLVIAKKMEQERKLVRSVVRLVACWFLAWTPYAAISITGIFAPHLIIHPIFSMLPAVFAKVSSVLNPYIYFFSNPHPKREFLLLYQRVSDWVRGRVRVIEASFSR
jgi:r-opsin